MRFSLDQLSPSMRDQVLAKLGEQSNTTISHSSHKKGAKGNRRKRLIESMRQSRGQAHWVMVGDVSPALALWLPGALLASLNDLLSVLNLSTRIAYRNATHEAVWRAVVDLPRPPAGFDSPFGITVYRYAPVMRQDLDAINAKYFIDGIVKTGLVPDDDPANVGELRLKRGKGDWAAAMLVHVLHAPVPDPESILMAAFPEHFNEASLQGVSVDAT